MSDAQCLCCRQGCGHDAELTELALLRARLAALRDLADTMRANPAPGETVVLGMIEVCLTATMGADGVLEATGEGPDEGES